MEKTTRAKWLKYLIEIMTLTLALGLFAGIIIGFVRSWKYVSEGFLLPILGELYVTINYSLFIAFLFLFLFLLVFLALHRVIRNMRWACFIASAVSCIPFFLFWGYRINKANGIHLFDFLERENVIFNLKIGIGFIFIWLLISTVLFFWTKSRIISMESFSFRLLSSLVGVFLILHVCMYLFHTFHTAREDSPNVIILLVDCLRADHLSSYGYSRSTTPNIDEFSRNAVVFTQAISQSTFTKTSVASLFTSLYPFQHGIYEGAGDKDSIGTIATDVLGEEETTLAEVLLQNRFLTVAWTKLGHLAPELGFTQGFIEYHAAPISVNNVKSMNKKFMEWAKRIGKKHKFFAYIHYNDLHAPYKTKPPYDTLYLSKMESYGKPTKFYHLPLDKRMALYDGQLTYIDTQIGILLENLKREGLYDNSLIILTSDHGEGFGERFGEHRIIEHSSVPYDILIRVPLIIKFPKSFYAGRFVRSQVSLIDVMPTVLDYLKIKTDRKLSGFSLLNYLDNDKKDKVDYPKYAISEIFNKLHFEVNGLSIRTEEFKYIYLINKEDELYNLMADPREQNNIIKMKPEMAEEFRKMLPPILSQSEKNRKRTMKVNYEKKMIEDLKTLGYIQ